MNKHNSEAGTTNGIWSESKHGTECQSVISLVNQSGSNQKEEIEDDLIPKDNTHTHARHCDHFLFSVCVSVCNEVTSVLQETLRCNNCFKIILHSSTCTLAVLCNWCLWRPWDPTRTSSTRLREWVAPALDQMSFEGIPGATASL